MSATELYLVEQLTQAVLAAKKHLPAGAEFDALKWSTAGVVIDNRLRLSTLTRRIDPKLRRQAQEVFVRVHQATCPKARLVVHNDGDVGALWAAQFLGARDVLYLGPGSSTAGGYISDLQLTDWVNEVAFVPVDLSAEAPLDDWVFLRGLLHSLFSQRVLAHPGKKWRAAVQHFLDLHGDQRPLDQVPLPERLKALQAAMEKDDPTAIEAYRTIGIYLGYTILLFAQIYPRFDLVCALGRVIKGKGGEIILATAAEVIRAEDWLLAQRLQIKTAPEDKKEIGQAEAAAAM